ncbi:MAG: filamentous hemagglutinin N-terminal domain-containing protein, partial [Nevskia sp.]|nr:filamentous hemagglutinin N-terminal domain-containing protein [Nevskia sp.]
MTKRPPLQPDRRPCSLAVRLSPHGLLRRYALLSGMGLSVIAGGTFPIAAQAAPFGSAAWLSQMNAARAGGTAGTGAAGSSSAVSSGTATVGGVTTAQQAERQAQHSMNDLLNALSAIRAAQFAQSVAAQAAVKGPNNLGKDPNHPGQMLPDVPDGIGVGGLQIATGADGTPVIQGAGAPTANAGNTVVTVDQNAPKAILTWQTFNVGKNTTLVFDQSAGTQKDGSNSWVALNRVLDPTAHPAQILGTIKAQGDVYIIDGSGIIFGGSSQVNTHSLLASSMQLFSTDTAASNSQFLGGGLAANLGFTPVRILVGGATPSQDGKSVVTTGDITIQQGAAIRTGETGYSLIAAPNVYNYGSITATDGQAILAAGTEVSLSSGGNSSQLAPTLTGALRINNPNGGSIDLTPEGHLINDGLIQSQRGNITLVGYQIDQECVLKATTSVSRPGSITISAHDENAMDGSGPGRGGSLTFGAQSVTAILPEEDGATTASSTAASAAFQPGSATFSGDSITFLGGKGGGALVEAPGAALTISADLVGSAASQAADDRGKHVQGRVYMADGSIIDVSGWADVELPVADTLVTIGPLTENDLADSPLQRGGFLFTQTVTVDSTVSGTTAGGQSWIGSPVIDASAYVQNVPRKIDQLLVNAGSVNLSGSEVITAKYSNIDLDGGFINYLAGMVGATTNLLGADGHVYNIANADPSIAYVGFAGQYVVSNPRFNSTQTYTDPVLSGGVAHYDPGFIQGGNAGTLNIAVGVSSASGNAGTAILDGGLSAHAYAGRNQVAFGSAPAGGTLSIGKTSAALSPSYVVTNHGVDLNQLAQGASGFTYNTPISSDGSDPTVGTTNLSYWSPLNGNTISTAGFSHVAINAYQGQIVEDHGATLAVQPAGQGASGSSISLNAAEVTVDGNLTARAGNINIVTNGLTSGPTFKLNSIGDAQAPGNITIGADATLDASGEWVNDSGLGAAQFSGSQFINGGSISLMAAQSSSIAASGVGHQTVAIDTTGSVTVNGTLDVSSGGYVQSNGKLLMQNGVPVGQGGSITLETYALGSGGYFNGLGGLVLPAAQPVGGQVQLAGATLRSAGFSGGGTLTIQAPGFQIVPAGTVVSINGVPQTVNGPVTDPVSGTLYLPSGYFQQGFGGYVLNAEYDATIAAGTAAKNQVILSQQNLI